MFEITDPALADVMARRRRQGKFRVAIGVLSVASCGVRLGWISVLSWFGFYAGVHAMETCCFRLVATIRAGRTGRGGAPGRIANAAALTLLVFNSTVFGALTLIDVRGSQSGARSAPPRSSAVRS
nr:hypothetical protein [uncultured Lichenicoccus sp.]